MAYADTRARDTSRALGRIPRQARRLEDAVIGRSIEGGYYRFWPGHTFVALDMFDTA